MSDTGPTGFLYKQTEAHLWTVGHYDADGRWQPDTDHSSAEEAAERVRYLNGGDLTRAPETAAQVAPDATEVTSGVTLLIEPTAVLASILGTGRYNPEYDEEEPYGPAAAKVVELAATQLAKHLRADVAAAVTDQVRSRVAEIVEETLAQGVQPADPWGQPKGQPTTVAGLVRVEVERFMTATEYDQRSRSNRSKLQTVVENYVKRELDAELGKAITAARNEAVAQVKARAAEVIAQVVTPKV